MKGWQPLVLAFVAMLALLTCIHAQSSSEQPPSLDLDALASPWRLANESVSASPAKVNDARWLFLVYINGTPALMVDAKENAGEAAGGWNAQVLQNSDELRTGVRLYYGAQGGRALAIRELEAAQKLVLEYNSSRTRERACLRALGMEQRPCSDYESCLKSCYMSVEFCQPLAQANGQPFIYQMWDYENRTQRLDGAILAATQAYGRAWNGLTFETLEEYNASLDGIWARSVDMLNHPFSGPLCQKPFYDSATRPKILSRLGQAAQWLEPVEDGRVESAKLAQEMGRKKALKQEATGAAGWMGEIGLDWNGALGALALGTLLMIVLGWVAWRSLRKQSEGPKKEEAEPKEKKR